MAAAPRPGRLLSPKARYRGPMPPSARDWQELREAAGGSLLQDEESRERFATDESIYRVLPLAVVAPQGAEGVAAVLRFASQHRVPVTARAGGTSLAGQAVGPGIILDLSRQFERILEIDAAAGWVEVEPGVVLAELNGALAGHGKQFGPDPSSFESCRVGGMVGNNASGMHHRIWGAVVDNVLGLTLLLANGERIRTSPVELGSRRYKALCAPDTLEARLYREVPPIIERLRSGQAASPWPRVEKSSSGYRLDKALEGGVFDLGKLVCGSEGTLAIVLSARLRVVDRPPAKGLLVLYFGSLKDAARGVTESLSTGASAVEMIDERVVEAMRKRAPKDAARFRSDTRAVLFVEYMGKDLPEVEARMEGGWRRLREETGLAVDDQATTDPSTMEDLWRIRRGVEPLLSEVGGSRAPVGFVEDTAVPVERLAEHVEGLYAIFERHGLKAAAYGHASTGHLHIRPYLDLSRPEDRALMATVAGEVFDHTRRLGGTLSGEHGDGLLRSEFLASFFGEAYDAMVEIKRLFDPLGILNPGKKTHAVPGQIARNLRPRAPSGPRV